jgi:hypothetical protein
MFMTQVCLPGPLAIATEFEFAFPIDVAEENADPPFVAIAVLEANEP